MTRFVVSIGLLAALFATSACSLSSNQSSTSMADFAYVPSQASSYTVVIEPGIDAF